MKRIIQNTLLFLDSSQVHTHIYLCPWVFSLFLYIPFIWTLLFLYFSSSFKIYFVSLWFQIWHYIMTYHSLILISTRNFLHPSICLSSSLFKTINLSSFPFPPFFSHLPSFLSPLVCLSLDVRLLPSARARDWRSVEFLLTSEFISHENNNHLVLHSSLRLSRSFFSRLPGPRGGNLQLYRI